MTIATGVEPGESCAQFLSGKIHELHPEFDVVPAHDTVRHFCDSRGAHGEIQPLGQLNVVLALRPGLAEDRVRRGDLLIDRVAHRVKRAGAEVHLGPTEFRLLDYLMQHPGRVFSREQLLDAVWGSDVYVEARTVDVHIGRLRKALVLGWCTDPIRTVRGAGYSFEAA